MVYSAYSVLCVDYRDKKAKDVSCDTIETRNCLFCTYIATVTTTCVHKIYVSSIET